MPTDLHGFTLWTKMVTERAWELVVGEEVDRQEVGEAGEGLMSTLLLSP